VLEGEFEVEVGGETQRAKAGETLRYRCDRPHTVRCAGEAPSRATMVCILKAAVMD
jgi:XRE family transcriptional regulator, regulator of sulfur utilization